MVDRRFDALREQLLQEGVGARIEAHGALGTNRVLVER
jgi:hypothetical protein